MTRQTSWLQKRIRISVIIAIAVVFIGAVLIFLGYRFQITGTGFLTKTVWDWLQLLIIPILLAIGGLWFSQVQKDQEQNASDKRARIEREIALDNQREIALKEYFDKMSELLLEKKLRQSKPDDEVRTIARVRTLTVLNHLNPSRRKSVLQFLIESGLIKKEQPIINLQGANFSEVNLLSTDILGISLAGANMSTANLSGADLTGDNLAHTLLIEANLRDANLSKTDMFHASLVGANLNRANLRGADLMATKLMRADLREANLTGAKVSDLMLESAKSLKGAIMPDGSKHT